MKIHLGFVLLLAAIIWIIGMVMISQMYPPQITCAIPMYPVYDYGATARSLILCTLLAGGLMATWFNLEIEICIGKRKEKDHEET
jgi:hypothetical protein